MGSVISPPLRSIDDQDSLWQALVTGDLDLVATDHVPDRIALEKRYTGQPFTEVSNGAPGIETLLAVTYARGVSSGTITVERLTDILSTTPAKLFGMPRKGAIAAGMDADLVIFDPSARRVIRQDELHHTSDYTPYEGMTVMGSVRDVLLRGVEIIRNGTYMGGRGQGRYVGRSFR